MKDHRIQLATFWLMLVLLAACRPPNIKTDQDERFNAEILRSIHIGWQAGYQARWCEELGRDCPAVSSNAIISEYRATLRK